MFRALSIPIAVAVTLIGVSNVLSAADQPVASSIQEFRGCATCSSAAAACDSCGKVRGGFQTHYIRKPCTPHQPTLAPGACYGHFQTQWNRWEDVCPLPYKGVGHVETPKPVPMIPPMPLPKAGGSDGPIPKIPSVPGKN